MKVQCAHDALVNIKDLKPHPKNRNEHPKDQLERLAKILEYQGWRYPIKVSNQSGFITSGHGRLAAAKINKWKEVPVDYQDYESDEQEYADVQSDNAIASWAELNISGINADIELLGPDFDIDLLGIKNFVIEPADKDPGCDEDEVPEHVEPKTKLGDIYQLGRHRLMCGDSTQIDAVEKLMAGEKADMVFTDPPYGFGYEGDFYQSMTTGMKRNTNSFERLKNDSGDWDFDAGILLGYFHEVAEIFLWGADYYCWTLPKNGSWIVWDKLGGHQSMDNMPGASFELCWSKSKHKRHLISLTWRGCFGHNKKNDGDKKIHPTQKPVTLAEAFFEKWGSETKNVVDLFGGSGSTLIACEKTNRKCFMMELDPHYCDVIVARWEKYTGQKVELIGG